MWTTLLPYVVGQAHSHERRWRGWKHSSSGTCKNPHCAPGGEAYLGRQGKKTGLKHFKNVVLVLKCTLRHFLWLLAAGMYYCSCYVFNTSNFTYIAGCRSACFSVMLSLPCVDVHCSYLCGFVDSVAVRLYVLVNETKCRSGQDALFMDSSKADDNTEVAVVRCSL